MAMKVEERTYEDAVSWLREHGFDLIEAPGTQGRVFLRKYNCSAAIQKTDDGGVKIFAYPGYLISSEISYVEAIPAKRTALMPQAMSSLLPFQNGTHASPAMSSQNRAASVTAPHFRA